MNYRSNEYPHVPCPEMPGDIPSCVPLIRPDNGEPAGKPEQTGQFLRRSHNHGTIGRKDPAISRDAFYSVWRDNTLHVVSENYGYKTEPYYTILRHELEGTNVQPSSAAVLDAYVVPVCLERAHLAGIPVCAWGISQGYTPLPSILYGLNYFATAADYTVVCDSGKAKEVVKHITNKGKYPFCYQKLDEGAEIGSCIAICGKTVGNCRIPADIAKQVYDIFAIPLLTIVYVKYGNRCLLSSLSPTKYSRLSTDERSILSAFLSRQEFL